MAYERTNWQNGDVISSEKLNKMEAGIEYACSLEHEVEDPTEGQVLKYDAEKGKFVNEDVAIETNIQNPTDGQTLKYDAASGKWVNGEGGGSTEPLYVELQEDQYFINKTFNEIKAAVIAGRNVFFTTVNNSGNFMADSLMSVHGEGSNYVVAFYNSHRFGSSDPNEKMYTT